MCPLLRKAQSKSTCSHIVLWTSEQNVFTSSPFTAAYNYRWLLTSSLLLLLLSSSSSLFYPKQFKTGFCLPDFKWNNSIILMIPDVMPAKLQATVNLGKSRVTKDRESNRRSIDSLCSMSFLWKTLLIPTSICNIFKLRTSYLICQSHLLQYFW